jgi:hypothetical protein
MKNKKLKFGAILGVCLMTAITLYAANLGQTDKDKCFGTADQTAKDFCCANACQAINSNPQDVSDCTKDCKDYYPGA